MSDMRGQKQTGFTIIEMLIVVVVIAILATVSIVAYGGVQERARDARRMSDITHINDAIQLYITYQKHAPYLGATNCAIEGVGYADGCFATDMGNGGYGDWTQLGSDLQTYMGSATLPKDPCGIKCFKKQLADDGDGFFAYKYNAPKNLYDDGTGAPTNSDYKIFAENLESKTAAYGFGYGSF